jgi:hypothetical protein
LLLVSKEATSITNGTSRDPLETHWHPKKLSFLSTENGDTTDYWITTTDLYLSMQINSDQIIFWEHNIVHRMPVENGATALPGVNYTRTQDSISGPNPNYPEQTANLYYELFHNNDSLKIINTLTHRNGATIYIETTTNIYSNQF